MMGKLFAKSAKLEGLSKTRILWVIIPIAAIFIVAVFYGVFAPDEKNVADTNNQSQYLHIDTAKTLEQIMDKVSHINSSHPLSSSPVIKPIISLESKGYDIPPIVSSDDKPFLKRKQEALQRFELKQVDNKYASVSAKSLVFSSINRKSNASSSNMPMVNTSPGGPNNIGINAAESSIKSLNVRADLGNSDSAVSDITKPSSPYQLNAGSVIPATMINGINSDLPGQVVAQVRENIYNSATRQYLLIPQGAKLIGAYNSNIVYGQERLMVAWIRVIYPNGSSINLKAMPGTDLEGYAGFSDQVDNKYWRIFGASFIMGVITAGMQYSQNSTNPNVQSGGIGMSSNPTMGQTLAGSLGQQLGQTGLMVTQKNLNLQPTLIIRPGYLFNIMITADLVLSPYINVK